MALEIRMYDGNLTSPTLLDDLTDRASKLQFSTALNGGFKVCRFNVAMRREEAWLWLSREGKKGRHFSRVTVHDGLTLVWEGRVMEVQLNIQMGEESVTVVCYGYWNACRDQFYSMADHTDWTAGSGHFIHEIIAEMLTEECPDINSDQSNIAEGTVDFVGLNYTTNEYPQTRINELTAVSDADHGVWFFAIWDDRKPYLFKRTVAKIDWHVWLDSFQNLSLDQSAVELRNAILPFSGTTERSTVTDAASLLLYPRREEKWNLPTGIGATPAEDAGTMHVTEQAYPRQKQAFSINGSVYRTTADSGGKLEEVPKWFIRAGEVIRIQDLVPASAALALDDVRTFYIMETVYDYDTDSLQIQPDRRSRKLSTILPGLMTLEQ